MSISLLTVLTDIWRLPALAKKRSKKSRQDDAISSPPIARRTPVVLSSREIIDRIRREALTRQLADIRRRAALTAIEDRRTFNPAGPRRSARSFNRAHHALKVKPVRGSRRLPTKVMFDAPKKVLVCVRRQRRKEVIFAKGKAGRGHARLSPRRNWYSDVSC